ncbi:MAG: hypothetical protein ACW990_18440 [Promethearchaeota archaeon]
MEKPKETDPSTEDSDQLETGEFNKDDFSVQMEETKDGSQTFYVKSEEFFQNITKALKNFGDYIKFKFKKVFTRNNAEEKHYKLSLKIHEREKRLEKKMMELEISLNKTRQLTSEIKRDTEKIVIDVEWVRILIERQMLKIKNVEKYMKKNLGSDWSQLKNRWTEYKQGDITRGDFIKTALQKLGKTFLGIFVNTT